MNEPATSGLRDMFRAVAEQIDRLEAENHSLGAERDRLSRALDDAERRSSLSAALLMLAQRESRQLVEEAIRRGEQLRAAAELRAQELRDYADRIISDADADARRLEAEARSESKSFIDEMERLVMSKAGSAGTVAAETPAVTEVEPVSIEPEVPSAEVELPAASLEQNESALFEGIQEAGEEVLASIDQVEQPLQATVADLALRPEDGEVPVAELETSEAPKQEAAPGATAAGADSFGFTDATSPVWVAGEPQGESVLDSSAIEEATLELPAIVEIPEPPRILPTTGAFEIVASPFTSFSTLVAFQKAIKGMPDVADVRAKSFLNGSLNLSLRYEGAEPIADRLRRLSGFRPDQLTITGNRIDLVVAIDESAIEQYGTTLSTTA